MKLVGQLAGLCFYFDENQKKKLKKIFGSTLKFL